MSEHMENELNEDIHGDNVEVTEIAEQHSWNAEEERKHRSGILSTARNPATQMPVHEIDDNTLVTFRKGGQDIQVPARLAAQYGVLTKDRETGEYRETSEQEYIDYVQSVSAPREPEEFERVSLGEQEERFIDGLSQFSQTNGFDPVNIISEYIASDGQKEPQAIAMLARKAGVPHEKVSNQFKTAVGLIQQQAHQFVRDNGLNPEEFGKWMRENIPNHARHSIMLRQALSKDLRPLKQYIDHYKSANGYGKKGGVFAPSGTQVKYTNTGEKYIEVPGYPPMSLQTAKRMGIVS